jgi:hypothetical protein
MSYLERKQIRVLSSSANQENAAMRIDIMRSIVQERKCIFPYGLQRSPRTGPDRDSLCA